MRHVRRAGRIGAIALGCAAVLGLPAIAHAGGNVQAGRAKASLCEVCHGLDGISKVPPAPNLAGQNADYLVTQLLAFKTGERKNDVMSLVAPTLSQKDIENLAAYYAAIEITVGKIPGE